MQVGKMGAWWRRTEKAGLVVKKLLESHGIIWGENTTQHTVVLSILAVVLAAKETAEEDL